MDSEFILAQAKEERFKGNHEAALELLVEVRVRDPKNADAWWVSALASHSLERLDEAVEYIRETLRLAPRFSNGWAQLGVVLIENGEEEEGKRALFHALRLKPGYPFALRQLAKFANQSNEHEAAISYLTELQTNGEADYHDLNLLGNVYRNLNNNSKAIEAYKESFATNPSPAPLYNLSLIYADQDYSQDLDAVDCLRRSLLIKPDYTIAKERLNKITERLSTLANKIEYGKTTLQKSEWYRHYLNPFEILKADATEKLDFFDAKWVQSSKKIIKSELILEDGKLDHLGGIQFDTNRVLETVDDLLNDDKKVFHWNVYQTPALLGFLTRGTLDHFLYSQDYFPIDILEALDWAHFQQWLSEPFAQQYDLVLSRALENKMHSVVECLFDGRRWVTNTHNEICFSSARRHVNRFLQPLRDYAKKSETLKPAWTDVRDIICGNNGCNQVAPLLNLLPEAFRDQQNEAITLIRDIALSCYNIHDDSDLSQIVLMFTEELRFKNARLRHQIEEDTKKIEALIKKERESEVKYVLGGERKMQITKEGVRFGEMFFPTEDITSVNWGLILTGTREQPVYDFLLSFRNDDFKKITFAWTATSDIEKQREIYAKLIKATLTYIAPSLIQNVKNKLVSGELLPVGNCVMRKEGVSFEQAGWFSKKTITIPWNKVGVEIQNGDMTVFERNAPARVTFGLRSAENAFVLQFLSENNNF